MEVWLVSVTLKNGLECKESFSFHITCGVQWEMKVPPLFKKWGESTVKDTNNNFSTILSSPVMTGKVGEELL